ncbi:MAG: PD-(D/E)XK nuclease family protein [Bacteroidia bacterium]|nr:PD-(D/E)XK nuclease family protein [Bacteroidia bacterium]
MQSFLEKTVDYLYKKYGDDVSKLCIVLPNRRAGLFLKTHLSKKINKTFWAPEIYATEDFVDVLSGLQSADTTTLLFELFECIKEHNPQQKETFDEFSKWAPILVNDFNEIDRYMVDYKQLFGNLKDIKELESWSLNNEELTEFQTNYLEFWKSLKHYYELFSKRLLSKNICYQGLAYKIVAENIDEKIKKHNWKKIIFCGFNALNKAEEIIIEKLLDSNKAEIIWDTDTYYINNTVQEAGKFYRKHDASGKFKKKEEHSVVFEENLLSTEAKKITVIGAAKNIAQAKVSGNIISELKTTNESLQNTAVVLADENLLFPVLHSLPENLSDINVTMGYPLKSTPINSYIDLIFTLHEKAQAIQKGKSTYSFYHVDIIKFLAHPYTNIALSRKNETASARPIIQIIQNKNIVFASYASINSVLDNNDKATWDILKPIFSNWNTPKNAIKTIEYIIELLKNGVISQFNDNDNKSSLELEYLFAFTKIFKRIDELMVNYPSSIESTKTLKQVANQIIRSTTLPFYGEPLIGLQVMGMLETRTLDFENIVLLSCNEDILPSTKTSNSFIPFELKRHFGLPTYSDKDAIFSYHFYRLLQRAKNIYLLYNTESDATGNGERSRFITQLLYELPKINKQVEIIEQLVNIPIKENKSNEIIIQKSESILEQLNKIADYGFSPSLLNKYINCSLQFYFHAIAKLRETEEVEEQIGADTLGNVIHLVLETMYLPYINTNLKIEHIKEMKKQTERITTDCFEKFYSKEEISYGKNLLTFKVALKFIDNFLDNELKMVEDETKLGKPIFIKGLEVELSTEIDIGKKIKIKGKSDRIDAIGNTIRIVDYKTGQAKDNELNFTEMDEMSNNSKLAKSFQLLSYAFMYQRMNPSIKENILSGIITFRELSKGLKTVKLNKNESLDTSVLDNFEVFLKNLLAEIFNTEIPFSQTDSTENCDYCSFKGICNR